MTKIYGIISGKGGVGKTTSAINLAAAINSLNKQALVVDANLSTPNVGLHLGAPLLPITLNHVLNNKAKLEEAIYEHESGLKILPSALSPNKVNYQKLPQISNKLRKLSYHVIFDSSAGIGEEVEAVVNSADEIILVTQAEMPAITDALKALKIAKKAGKDIRGFILTRHKGRKSEMSLENIKDMLELPLLGIIPEDRKVQKSLSMKNAIINTHPNSKTSKSYKKIAKKIIERIKDEDDGDDQQESTESFLKRLFK